jgi:hypothetical protein
MNLKKEPENNDKTIPSVSDVAGESRMARDAQRLAKQVEADKVQLEEDIQDTLINIDASGIREDNADMAMVEVIGAKGEAARPTKKPVIRFMTRKPFDYVDAATGRTKSGFKTQEVIDGIPFDPDLKTGGFLSIEINGIAYINSDKLLLDEDFWREGNNCNEEFRKEYTPTDKKKSTTVCWIIRDDRSKAKLTLNTFIDTNVVSVITWAGYTFLHQGFIYHNGLKPRDRRVMGQRGNPEHMIANF